MLKRIWPSRGNRFYLSTLIGLIVLDVGVVAMLYWEFRLFKWDGSVGLTVLVGLPAFVLTIAQLSRTIRLQRAAFVRDYVSKIFTDTELSGAFYDLVQTYTDRLFERIEKLAQEKYGEDVGRWALEPVVLGDKKPIFLDSDDDREVGKRHYHPALFQGSLEEKRLDALLNYLNVIGYYYHNGFLRMADIAGSLGSHLLAVRRRKAILRYMEICNNRWSDRGKDYTLGVPAPFSYLDNLLVHFESYAKSNADMINRKLKRIPT